MTGRKGKADPIDVKGLLSGDDAFIRTVVRAALQEVLEAEMTVVSDKRDAIDRQVRVSARRYIIVLHRAAEQVDEESTHHCAQQHGPSFNRH